MKIIPLVDVIIVGYNSEKFIEKCLQSLLKQEFLKKDYMVTFVDNGSTDRTQEIVKSFPEVRLMIIRKNAGFSGGNNFALERCRSKYALLLVHDTIVDKSFIKELVDVMEKDSSIAACGGAEHPYDRTLRTSRKVEEGSWIGCGATIFRMDALRQIGFFDKNYYMYNEDVDISWRLKFHGWKIYYTPWAIWHHYGWMRELTIDDPRVFYASLSRIYLLFKFASLGQMIRSLRLYLGKGGREEGKKKATLKKQKYVSGSGKKAEAVTKMKMKLLLKLVMLSIPKIPVALVKRFSVRGMPYFNQRMADELIRDIDMQFYNPEEWARCRYK